MSSSNEILLTDSVITPADCDAIVAEFSVKPFEPGRVRDNEAGGKTRQSQIQFVPFTEAYKWIFDKLAAIVVSGNTQKFKFQIDKFEEGFQFTKYEPSDHYSWHSDLGDEDERVRRKLSLVVLLNDDYEGGDLQFFPSGIAIPRRKGLVALFPSYLVHRVAPVTRGTRYSLVSWVAGDEPFK
jgi:PKHD-type hydroxylase